MVLAGLSPRRADEHDPGTGGGDTSDQFPEPERFVIGWATVQRRSATAVIPSKVSQDTNHVAGRAVTALVIVADRDSRTNSAIAAGGQ